MSTLDGRTQTAVLVIDLQRDVIAPAHDRDGVLSRVRELLARAREHGVSVVWVQHSAPGMPIGSEGWEIAEDANYLEGEHIIHKIYGDAFEGTDLEDLLAESNVSHLVTCGAQSDACVRSTIHGAFTRGYDVTLVSDAHTTEDLSEYGAPSPDLVIAHTNLYWEFQKAPGRTAAVVPAAEVSFAVMT